MLEYSLLAGLNSIFNSKNVFTLLIAYNHFFQYKVNLGHVSLSILNSSPLWPIQ